MTWPTWDLDLERAAVAERLSTRYGACVQSTQLLDEGQADAGAFMRAALGALHAVKALEEVRQLVRWDAGAGVAHRELELRRLPDAS